MATRPCKSYHPFPLGFPELMSLAVPLTPYIGTIISTLRPHPAIRPLPSPPCVTGPSSPPALKRRAHTKRALQAAPSSDLPPVSEEDEGADAEDDEPPIVMKPRRRPRPTPLIPPRSYGSPKMQLILEIPDTPGTSQDQTTTSADLATFALSPSTLFARRRSETILDFPVPPSAATPHSHSLSTPITPPRHSPTPSNTSLSSASTDNSSPCPLTPSPSENEDDNDEMRSASSKGDACFVTIEDFAQSLDARSPGPLRRSASVVSLRSFSTAEFDAQAELIYTMMHSGQQPLVSDIQRPTQAPREQCLPIPVHDEASSPHLVLSVHDTTRGGSFDVPLMLCSYLSPPSTPGSPNSDDSESDGEGIPISWSDSDTDDGPLEAACSSSEDEASDDGAPSRTLDPGFRSRSKRRRVSSTRNRSPQLPSLQDAPDTPSVYSVASPTEWNHDRTPPRKSLVPSDVSSSRLSSATMASSRYPPLSFYPPTPELRSRFSTSTLGSIPEPPSSTSSKNAFFARLTRRTKGSSSSASPKRDRLPLSPKSEGESSISTATATRASMSLRGRRSHVPASPAPSAFSFSIRSASSRSSFDSGDSCSCVSDESSGSMGLRRPPIPIELFLRG